MAYVITTPATRDQIERLRGLVFEERDLTSLNEAQQSLLRRIASGTVTVTTQSARGLIRLVEKMPTVADQVLAAAHDLAAAHGDVGDAADSEPDPNAFQHGRGYNQQAWLEWCERTYNPAVERRQTAIDAFRRAARLPERTLEHECVIAARAVICGRPRPPAPQPGPDMGEILHAIVA